MTLANAVKTRVKELLTERKISLYKLERIGGISPNTTKDLMAEKNKSVNLKTVMQIIRAFEMRASDFFDERFDSFDLDID